MKDSGFSINNMRKHRSQTCSGVQNTEQVQTQRPAYGSIRKRKDKTFNFPIASSIGFKSLTLKWARFQIGSVEKWFQETIQRLTVWLGRRFNRLKRYERAGVGQVLSWVYIPEVEVNHFVEKQMHKTMKYRTFTDQVSSYIKSKAELMTCIPFGSSSEKKLTKEDKMAAIVAIEDWPKCYFEEVFDLDVTMTNNTMLTNMVNSHSSDHDHNSSSSNMIREADNSFQTNVDSETNTFELDPNRLSMDSIHFALRPNFGNLKNLIGQTSKKKILWIWQILKILKKEPRGRAPDQTGKVMKLHQKTINLLKYKHLMTAEIQK